MQIIFADAKIMRASSDIRPPFTSRPLFEKVAEKYALELSGYDTGALSDLLHCSRSIAADNYRRFQVFPCEEEKLPAVLSFYGQAYKSLRAADFGRDDFLFAQSHLFILSFLYGMLRPLDMIHPYRMDGSVRLSATGGEKVASVWRPLLTDCLIRNVKNDDGVLLHLATEEYEHIFDWGRVEREVRVVRPIFYMPGQGGLRVVSMYAKSCRGAMARFVISERLSDPSVLASFSYGGFVFRPASGDADHLIFVKQ